MLDGQESKGSLSLRKMPEGFGESIYRRLTENFEGERPLACAEIAPGFFHRSCGKACGKAALRSYKFLRILYF
jgi:hypothetical protein